MVNRTTKLRWRRLIRKRRRQVEEIGHSTEKGLEKHLIRRLVRLPGISRFLVGWIGLLFMLSVATILQTRALSDKYQTVVPKPGGAYHEGIVGSFTNANPLFTSGSVDSSVSKLVFAGLLKYDENNKLVGDLAESWSVDSSEKIYTVKLRPGLTWHDGHPLTSKDATFTYKLIQDPDTKSQLQASWTGIGVEAPDENTIIFTLPSSLSSFPHSLVGGLIPEHILNDIEPSKLRASTFNNVNPIGSGPFRFSGVQVVGETSAERQERIALSAFEAYHLGKPKLESFTIRTFAEEEAMIDAYEQKLIQAMVGLVSVPDRLEADENTQEFGIPLTGQVLVFFKTSQDVLKDPAVRKALVTSVDKKAVIDSLDYPLVALDGPLLKSHIGYDKKYRRQSGNPEEAKKILEAAGWKVDKATGIRVKDKQQLSFRLFSETTSEYAAVAGNLQKQWRDIGVDMKVDLQNDEELQSTLASHNYDALLYGISIGSDPDVYAFWHSSQADPRAETRLNFSEYKSAKADDALEGGRTRSDPRLRAIKYQPFLEAWRDDAPALALYQPRFLYVVREPIYNLEVEIVNSASDRLNGVHEWMIREGKE